MTCVDFSQEHLDLIKSIVIKNPRYRGNEDLLEDFCSETCNRSYSLFTSVDDIDNLKVYLTKVASSAILSVLKNSGRLKRNKSSYEQVEEIPITTTTYNTDDNGNILFDIADPGIPVEETLAKKEEIKLIRNIIYKLDLESPDKRFFELFKYRYIDVLKQSEIASKLDISQGEVSKRIAELACRVNDFLKTFNQP